MPDNPNSWLAWIENLPPWIEGFIMAFVMSFLRVIYDKGETDLIRVILESLICGALTLAAGSALVAIGLGTSWYLFCGGLIGFLGSQFVRATAIRFIGKKTG